MTQKKTPIQERLERYRSGLPSESTQKRRRVSRMLLFVNLIILVGIILIFKMPEQPTYFSTGISYGGIHYRVSLSRNQHKSYMISLSLTGEAETAATHRYRGGVAAVSFTHGATVVMKTVLGANVASVSLPPGENRNFTLTINEEPLKTFALNHPELLVPPRKAFLFSKTQHIPLEVKTTFNTETPVTITMNINYEVP